MDRIRVLLVGVGLDGATSVSDILEAKDERFEVITESRLEDALERLDSEEVDCLVTDVAATERDRSALLTATRDSHPSLSLVVLTSEDARTTDSEATSVGVTEYVQKPAAEDSQLVARIQDAIERCHTPTNFQKIFEGASDGFVILDAETCDLLEVNQRLCLFLGYEHEELLDLSIEDIFSVGSEYTTTAFRRRVEAAAAGEIQTFEWMVQTADDEPIPVQLRLKRIPVRGRSCVVVRSIDLSERQQRERTLRTMYRVTREMAQATTKREVCKIAVHTAAESLELPIAIVHEYDSATDSLQPLAASPTARERLDGLPALERGKGLPWQAYESSEPVIWDAEEYDAFADFDPRMKIEGLAILPLGNHGIFSVAPGDGKAGIPDSNYAKMLAQNTRAVLDRVERERQLQAREHELKRQNERLDQFARVVSHDLRNPLGIAKTYLGFARETGEKEDFDAVEESLDRMNAMIEDLLTVARAETTIEDTEAVVLRNIADKAWNTAQTGNARLENELPEELTVKGDRSLLRNVFENLFRNPVDHNDPPVAVRIGLLGDGNGETLADFNGFYVEDDGDGIPKEQQEDVFDLGHTTAEEGTGFGLAIVNELVEAHGWQISVNDAGEGGARFEIRTES